MLPTHCSVSNGQAEDVVQSLMVTCVSGLERDSYATFEHPCWICTTLQLVNYFKPSKMTAF
jgi:hypothetical protein